MVNRPFGRVDCPHVVGLLHIGGAQEMRLHDFSTGLGQVLDRVLCATASLIFVSFLLSCIPARDTCLNIPGLGNLLFWVCFFYILPVPPWWERVDVERLALFLLPSCTLSGRSRLPKHTLSLYPVLQLLNRRLPWHTMHFTALMLAAAGLASTVNAYWLGDIAR